VAEGSRKEVLIEMIQVGNAVKVTAIDPVSGIEASIVGSPSMSEEILKRNAVRKLNYVLKKQRNAANRRR
jgi:Domain of unknown function (DUF6898)